MNKVVVLMMMVALASPALAGADCSASHAESASAANKSKCAMGTQACLDMMAKKLQNKGWVGLELDKSEDGLMVITRVVADSPAERAGFRKGDRLVALDGYRFGEAGQEAALKETYDAFTPGAKVSYTVARDGHERNLDVTLAKAPEQVLAQWIGGHMLEHVGTAVAQK